MAETQNFSKKKPLLVQLVSVIIFIGLCILACFTAFFRTGDINIPPISTILMTIFFLVFGIKAGVYTGTWLYGKKALVSIVIPSVTSMLVTVIMYIGEMVMMNQNLFRRGNGFIFSPLGVFPLSVFDIITIFISGIITYFILTAIKPKRIV
jgi:predicted neutral ceramidase superfamily lipid hydrolase